MLVEHEDHFPDGRQNEETLKATSNVNVWKFHYFSFKMKVFEREGDSDSLLDIKQIKHISLYIRCELEPTLINISNTPSVSFHNESTATCLDRPWHHSPYNDRVMAGDEITGRMNSYSFQQRTRLLESRCFAFQTKTFPSDVCGRKRLGQQGSDSAL